MLHLNNVVVRYGPVLAVDDVTLEVREGEIVSLVGTNGAGKSSLLRAIMGIAPVTGGNIEASTSGIISGRRPHWIARNCGFAYVAEDRNLFARLTVEENLELGAYRQRRQGRARLREALKDMYELFPRLQERHGQIAGTLSGGEQQMLVMARALISQPKLLLLDEPSLGLAPLIVEDIFSRFESVRQSGTSVLLVEQNSRVAFDVSSRGYVMESGRVVLQGRSKDLAGDDRVRQAYLGLVKTP